MFKRYMILLLSITVILPFIAWRSRIVGTQYWLEAMEDNNPRGIDYWKWQWGSDFSSAADSMETGFLVCLALLVASLIGRWIYGGRS